MWHHSRPRLWLGKCLAPSGRCIVNSSSPFLLDNMTNLQSTPPTNHPHEKHDHCHTCLPPSEKDSVLSLVHTARTPSLVHHPSADVHRRLLPSLLNGLFLFSSPLSPDLELAKATTVQGQGCTHMWVIRSYISPQAVNILRSLNYTLF